ncbi:hypothetical protein Hsar01_01811 [Haloferula sargassicola]|uniref:Uncharacterized protein n=1 Tax=Haloferula sargassicola TaxID=490096 RepID=A0ABP9ULW3_9BACT
MVTLSPLFDTPAMLVLSEKHNDNLIRIQSPLVDRICHGSRANIPTDTFSRPPHPFKNTIEILAISHLPINVFALVIR